MTERLRALLRGATWGIFLMSACTPQRGASLPGNASAADLQKTTTTVNPPLGGNASGNPAYVQSHFGTQGDFELAVPSAGNGLLYYWRDNDNGEFWNGPDAVFTDAGHFDGLSMIESNYGNMELAVVSSNALFALARDQDPVTPWHGPVPIASGVSGTPALIQSSFGTQGNFEVVVPSSGTGLLHFWRDNDNGQVWSAPEAFFGATGHFDAVTLIQSNYAGHLEGLATSGGTLYYFFHDTAWRGPWVIGSGCAGTPVLVQSRFGKQGNFEVAVPNAAAGIDYYWRDNDNGMTWHGPNTLFAAQGKVDALSMFESNYGSPGNMEIATRQGQALGFAFRNNLDPFSGIFAISAPTDPTFFAEPSGLLHAGYSQYLQSFTANPLANENASGIVGVDLGVSFEASNGDVAFLWGDAWTPGGTRDNQDSIATSTATSVSRQDPVGITWVTAYGGFLAMDLPWVDGGGMNVPLDAFVLGEATYVFANTGWSTYCSDPGCPGGHGHLALGLMSGVDPTTALTVFTVATQRFTNVSVNVVGDDIYIFGNGEPYRRSPVYLARAHASTVGYFSQWEFYRGVRDGVPIFGPNEGTAVPLFAAGSNWSAQTVPLNQRPPNGGIGEFSVRPHNGDKFIMTYATVVGPNGPSGVFMRTAPQPWGPWSAAEELIDGSAIAGHWQHIAPADTNGHIVFPDDGLGEYNRQDEWGGEYGPYLVPRWFTQNSATEFGLTFTLSSWNPYQAHLIRTVVTSDGHPVSPPVLGVGWAPATIANGSFTTGDTSGWTQVGGPFGVFLGNDDRQRVTTFGAAGDATVGQLYQDVWIDAETRQLAFRIHGGGAEVKLVRNSTGETVRAVHGRNENDTDLPVCWDVSDFRGESVRVLIDDQSTATWGFIGASFFQFLNASQDCTNIASPVFQ
jgi:hypothetical protein